jgi:hypothetical protein
MLKERGCEVPCLIDAVVSVIWNNLNSGEFAYLKGSSSKGHRSTYSRVQKDSLHRERKIMIGEFSSEGLTIHHDYFGSPDARGAACWRTR